MKRLMLVVVFLIGLSGLSTAGECDRLQWVTFPNLVVAGGTTIGPFAHVMVGMPDGVMTLLAHPASETLRAPLIPIATFDQFTLLWTFSYGKKSGESDAALFSPFDPTLPYGHPLCVPAR